MAERKKYIEVQIPILGSTLKVLGSPETLHDKTIKLDLTRKMRGKGLNVSFRITNKDKELFATPNRMNLSKTYIIRMIRKRTDYVEDSFLAKCADVAVTIKPFLITRKRVSRAVRRNLRNTTKEFLLEYVKDKNYLDVCYELLEGVLQRAMLPRLKKIYPLSFSDLRVFETKEMNKLGPQRTLKKEEAKEEIQGQVVKVEEESEELTQAEEIEKEKPVKKARKKKEETIEKKE